MCKPCYRRSRRANIGDLLNEQGRAYYADNREELNAKKRAKRQANPDAHRAQDRVYRQTYPDKVAARNADRRAQKKALFVERIFRAVVFSRDEGICHLCLAEVDPENWPLDHVIPLARGGPHCYANVAVAHAECNLQKNAEVYSADMDRWLAALDAYVAFHGKAA